MTGRIMAILAPTVLAGSLAGCIRVPATSPAAQMSSAPLQPPLILPTTQPETELPDLAAGQVAFRVLCDVLIVEGPGGLISGSAELWRHVREDTLGVQQVDHLSRNGLRIGVGRAGDFNEVIRLLLATRDSKVREGRLQFETEAAMEIIVTAEVRPHRAFVYAADGAVSGEEYPPGAVLYWVQAWHDVARIDTVRLTLVPEIRFGRVRERYYLPTLERLEQYRDVGRLFNEIKLELRQQRGEFLLISPNLKAEPGSVVGRALLTEVARGQTRETALLIRPRVVRSPNL